jgi:3',5'-cyclic AMP phosphodiesterase CpdA
MREIGAGPALIVLSAAVCLFLVIALAMALSAPLAALDANVGTWLHVRATPLVSNAMAAVSFLGASTTLTVIAVIVTHHPFDLPDGRAANELVGRADLAMDMLSACRCDLLLAGHPRISDAGSVAMHAVGGSHDAIVVQAGTATSTRGRGELNSFNAIHVDANRIEVQRFGWRPLDSIFEVMDSEHFERTPAGWKSLLG